MNATAKRTQPKDNDMNTIDLAPLVVKIEAITAKISASPYTAEESSAASAALAAMMSGGNFCPAELMKLAKTSQLASDVETLRQYRETAAADLMRVESRYVITDTPRLVSPAGFTLSDRVFIQTTIAIHTDTRKDIQSNVPLYCHDVAATAASN